LRVENWKEGYLKEIAPGIVMGAVRFQLTQRNPEIPPLRVLGNQHEFAGENTKGAS